MITFKGKYNTAVVMIDELDQTTISQIYSFLNHPAFAKTHIAIMADAHAGAGSCIGFTMKMNDYIIPNVVGVDIGCGVNAYPLDVTTIDFEQLDHFIKTHIPSGFNIRGANDKMANGVRPSEAFDGKFRKRVVALANELRQEESKVLGSIGTLGGGNHFIEVDQDDNGQYWLLIHSGSRNFGLRVANYHQNKAKELLKRMFMGADAYKGLEYLPMDMGGEEYFVDMRIAQEYASLNRQIMAELLIYTFFKEKISLGIREIETVHNYINFEDKIIRKGAISAHDGERLVIPFNMRDGVMIGVGKGSNKWNFSAPHGAGRVLSRSQAKKQLDLDEFQKEMEGIYTTTATINTIDEAPMAYKDKDVIVEAIGETVDVEFFMKPVYNFKSSGD